MSFCSIREYDKKLSIINMNYAILLQTKMLYNNFNYRDRASNLNLKHVYILSLDSFIKIIISINETFQYYNILFSHSSI